MKKTQVIILTVFGRSITANASLPLPIFGGRLIMWKFRYGV